MFADEELPARLQEPVEIGDRAAEVGHGAQDADADDRVEGAACVVGRRDRADADEFARD